MDNQQAKLQFDIGYLVGMLEGEGCITLIAIGRKGRKKITPYISITNTNPIVFDTFSGIAKSLGLPFYVSQRRIKSGKTAYRLEVTGAKRTKRWVDALLPYMAGKRRQLEILGEYYLLREDAGSTFPPKPYTQKELDLWHEVHSLNVSTANAPETTRRR